PWRLIRSAELASGHIVEDLRLGLELALAGSPPQFRPSARVTSQFPASAEGATEQRRRWEHGHIGMILHSPRYIYSAITMRNLSLLVLAFDLAVPPLAFFGLLLTGTFLIAACATFFGISSAALFIAAAGLAAFMLAVFVSWSSCGRKVLPLSSVPAVIPFL